MAEMVGHFCIEGSLDEGLGQLLEKAFLADEVFRLLVIRQERRSGRLEVACVRSCRLLVGSIIDN